jgi:Uncharacterized conserved protein
MDEITIKEPSLAEEKVLASRFIAILFPCVSVEEFETLLTKIKKDYPKATHYCYAYRLQKEEGFSDDGEPSRSVGLPLLSLLRGKGLSRVGFVVVRYFGGTKLGLGRLKRVYLEVASKALEGAPLFAVIPAVKLLLESDYSSYERIKKEALLRGYSLGEESFSSSVRFSLLLDGTLIRQFEETMSPSVTILTRTDNAIILRSLPQ